MQLSPARSPVGPVGVVGVVGRRAGRVLGTLALAGGLAACGGNDDDTPAPGDPVETAPPNAPNQTPAFPGQTRVGSRTEGVAFVTRTVADGLDHPWGLTFLPDGAMLVTERAGRLRIVVDGALSEPVAGLPAVDARGQGGLLDVTVDPDVDDNDLIYWSYAEPREGGNGTAVARGRLIRGAEPRVEDVSVIWRMTPTLDSQGHFGSRLVFDRRGALFITTGDRASLEGRVQSQRLDGTLGKVVRVNPDGSIPDDNPLVGRADALPEIWSYGHRNIQGAALHPSTGALWTVEHGARGGDEINVPEGGKDYGWPTISYGLEYTGEPIGEGLTQQEGMEQPRYYWDPVIAPSGMTFYDADLFPAWKGSLFIGALAGQHLVRLTLDGSSVIGEERLLGYEHRIRDVTVGPEGAIYVLTDADNGAILALVPPGT